jgi:Na+(H+)/acetate symporter ActP
MMIALHIVAYILTLAFALFLTRGELLNEKGKATVGDILTNTPGISYIPIINTMSLIIVGVAFLVWEVFGVGALCKKLWDKVKDIEL